MPFLRTSPRSQTSQHHPALSAAAFGAHYLPGVTAYVYGYPDTIATQCEWIAEMDNFHKEYDKTWNTMSAFQS